MKGMQFTPFRTIDHEKWKRDNPPDPALAAMTDHVRAALAILIAASDVYPELGGITFRDHHGKIWEMQIALSDATSLRSDHEQGKK